MSEVKSKPYVLDQRGIDRLSKIERRVKHLETLAHLQGPFMLFLIEDYHENVMFLVAAPDYSSAISMVSNADNVDYIGRASNLYDSPTIIRNWSVKL